MAELTLPSAVVGASPQSWPPPEAGPCILALDLGTTTGWALRTADGLITSGTVSFPGRFEGCGMRYLRLIRWLTEVERLVGIVEERDRRAVVDPEEQVERLGGTPRLGLRDLEAVGERQPEEVLVERARLLGVARREVEGGGGQKLSLCALGITEFDAVVTEWDVLRSRAAMHSKAALAGGGAVAGSGARRAGAKRACADHTLC